MKTKTTQSQKVSRLLCGRVDRERSWHDHRFSCDSRSIKFKKLYLALDNWYRDFAHLAADRRPSNALEIGAGIESLTLVLSFPGNVTSIDISRIAINN